MLTQRWRPALVSLAAVAAIWLVAMVGVTLARNSKVTAEKLHAYTDSVDFSKLSGDARARALHKLEAMLNALPMEERRKARSDRLARTWFNDMTESEKGEFIDATMPTGFKQMLSAFEQLPDDKRHRAIEDSLRRLRETQAGSAGANGATNNGPVLSDDLQAKVRSIGLKTFYSQSSAQTKAELAPVLEELQRTMESGRMFRGRQ